MAKLADIEGVGTGFAAKLKSAGVDTIEELLSKGARPNDREELARETGITPKLILEWVNLADLMRINGVGEEFADLLEEAGVDTVAELATRNAENLTARIAEIDEKEKLVRQRPGLGTVTGWIEQAKKLPRVIEY